MIVTMELPPGDATSSRRRAKPGAANRQAHPKTTSKKRSRPEVASKACSHNIVSKARVQWQRENGAARNVLQPSSAPSPAIPRGPSATNMLNYKTKNNSSPGDSGNKKYPDRGASTVMSLFASMTPKQGQLFSRDRSFAPVDPDEPPSSLPAPSPVPSTRLLPADLSPSLTTSASSPHQPLPPRLPPAADPCQKKSPSQSEEATEEQDKYPCLRRALSCTETPILPLGTYAVEFGFDVSTLPFMPNRRVDMGRRLLGSSVVARPALPASFLAQGCVRRDGYPKAATSPKPTSAKSNCDNHTGGGSTSSDRSSCHAEWQTSLTRTGPCYSKTGYPAANRSSTSTATLESTPPPAEQFNVFRHGQGQFLGDDTETKWGLGRAPVTSVVSPLTRPPSEWTESGMPQSGAAPFADGVSGTTEEQQQQRVYSFGHVLVHQECSTHRNQPSDALYATVWKKDNRTWLWKSRKGKRPASDAHRQYFVAKTWKKDNRTWLWKSRSRN